MPPSEPAQSSALSSHWTDRAVEICRAVSEPVAFVGVVGMLIASGATVVDVFLRALSIPGITALNEIVAMAFTVAVAACIPSGMARGISLAVDVMVPRLAPRTKALLTAAGSTLLLVFLVILSGRMGVFSAQTVKDARTTQLLEMPIAPFVVSAVALLAFAAIIQFVIVIRDWRVAFVTRYDPAQRPASAGIFDAALIVLGVICVALAVTSLIDFGIVQNWAQTYTTFTVVTSVIAVWIFLLCLIPLAAVLGLVGIFCCALFIGFTPALSAFVTEALGFLSNYQVAALPLFLMMGSFAAVAGR